MLRQRLIYGFLLAAVLIGLLLADAWLTALAPPRWIIPWIDVHVGHWLYNGAISTAVIALFAWLGVGELVRFASSSGREPFPLLSRLGACGLVIGPYVVFNSVAAAGRTGEAWEMIWLVVVLALAFLRQATRSGTADVMRDMSTTVFIILYIGGLAHFMCRLRMEIGHVEGAVLLLYSLFVVKVTDIGAYFTGRLLGRHKMIPWLSPKKTWEGLVGGVFIAAAVAVGLGHALSAWGVVSMPHTRLPLTALLFAFGILMAALSAAGDLCASLLKRDAAVKDSGEALPGFGGILDVLDSPLLAAPAAWWFWARLMSIGGTSAV